jgi:hypothetical protein
MIMPIQIMNREELDRLEQYLQRGVDIGALMGFDLKSEMLLWISLFRWLRGKKPLHRVEHEIYKTGSARRRKENNRK